MPFTKEDRFEAKLRCYLNLAINLADLSTCKRAKVGCVIVPSDLSSVYSVGYNGPPRGVNNDACTGEPKNCGCVHAEANGIIKLGAVDDALLITTTCPCYHCAGLIINSQKIKRVLYCTAYSDKRGLELLLEAGISHDRIC